MQIFLLILALSLSHIVASADLEATVTGPIAEWNDGVATVFQVGYSNILPVYQDISFFPQIY